MKTTSLNVIDPDQVLTPRRISTTPEIDSLLAAGAPVAIGVSGGKDSSAVAIAFVRYLRSIGHKGQVVLIHSDLGRVEWADSLPTCRRLAKFLDLELIVVRRKAGDMMDRWLTRWENNKARYINLECVKLILPWSTPSMRFCTSEMKTDIICRELRKRFPGQRIISVSGIRRSESHNRANAPITKEQPKLKSNKYKTSGLDLNAICTWSLADVFAYADEVGFELHEAYTKHKSTRVSCKFCIMGSVHDLQVSAEVPTHRPLLLEMIRLQIESTFAFQAGKWLGVDIARITLSSAVNQKLLHARQAAADRERCEAKIPKHLLYTKGWPTRLPTLDEARLIAGVRKRVGVIVGLPVRYTTARAVVARYRELMTARKKKHEKGKNHSHGAARHRR